MTRRGKTKIDSVSAVDSLDWQIRRMAPYLPLPTREFRFHKTRLWRFDFCWEAPLLKIALEVEGGVYIQGRHQRTGGFIGDIEKYNQATIYGYRLLRFTPKQIESLEALDTIKELFATLGYKEPSNVKTARNT